MKTLSFNGTGRLLHFKQWAHTSYAIFNTLNKEVRIGFLMISYFICLGYTTTFARTETDSINRKITLDEVQISSHRGPSVYSEVGRVVTVLSRSQIESLPVQSVPELLRYAMSLDIRERGPLGIQADISMRGGSFDQVMILLNGVNITDPQTGHHAFNLPVDLQSIERIEILQGPAARIYGPNAFSGAINLITGTSPVNKISLSGLVGENGLNSGNISITHNHEFLRNYLSFQKAGSKGYIPNTDFNTHSIFYQGQLKINKEQLSLQAGYSEKAFGANSFYTADYPDQYEKTRTFFSALSMETGTTIKVRPNIYWRRHHDRFELFRNYQNAAEWYSGHNYHLTDVIGAGVNNSIPWFLGLTSIGGEVRGETVWSNVLGNPMETPIKVPGEKDGLFTRSFTRNNASVFLEHNYGINGFGISGGVLMNRNSQTGYKTEWFPGMDISYWVSRKFKWSAAWNKSLRLPTFTDLFYSGPRNTGNPNLKPEEATTLESGLRWRDTSIDMYIGGFHRIGRNLIDWGRVPGEEKYTTSNINKVKATGLESSLQMNLLLLLPNQNFLHNLNINYSYIHQDKKADEGYESVYVLDHLRNKLNINLEHGTGINALNASWNIQYRDRTGYYEKSVTKEIVNYVPVWMTDLRLTWRKDNYRLYGEATNVFDVKYADLGELIQPGRWIKIGVAVDFGY